MPSKPSLKFSQYSKDDKENRGSRGVGGGVEKEPPPEVVSYLEDLEEEGEYPPNKSRLYMTS